MLDIGQFSLLIVVVSLAALFLALSPFVSMKMDEIAMQLAESKNKREHTESGQAQAMAEYPDEQQRRLSEEYQIWRSTMGKLQVAHGAYVLFAGLLAVRLLLWAWTAGPAGLTTAHPTLFLWLDRSLILALFLVVIVLSSAQYTHVGRR